MIRALIIGIIGAIGCIITFIFWPAPTMRAYLFAWLFWLGVSLGSLSMLTLQYLTGGRWGFRVRRLAEAATLSLPLLCILYIPLAVGAHWVFPWANAAKVQESSILQHRELYMHYVQPRVVIYFIVWVFFAVRLRILSGRFDATGERRYNVNLQRTSAAGMVFYFITMSLASVDWIASREVDWYSTTFGLLTVMGQSLTGLCFLIIMLYLLRQKLDPDVVHDLGNLLLCCVILWSYISFAQFLVIWIGNSNEDILFFVHRTHGMWWFIGAILMAGHFGFPFVVLLFQKIKRQLKVLTIVTVWVFCMRILDVLYLVAPSSSTDKAGSANPIDPLALVAIGGLFMAVFLWIVRQRPLVPPENVIDGPAGNYNPELS